MGVFRYRKYKKVQDNTGPPLACLPRLGFYQKKRTSPWRGAAGGWANQASAATGQVGSWDAHPYSPHRSLQSVRRSVGRSALPSPSAVRLQPGQCLFGFLIAFFTFSNFRAHLCSSPFIRLSSSKRQSPDLISVRDTKAFQPGEKSILTVPGPTGRCLGSPAHAGLSIYAYFH